MAQSKQEFTQMYVPEFKLTQVADINLEKLTNITSSSSAVQVLSQFIAQKGLTEQINVNEFVFILYLNKRNKVIAVTNLAIGGIDMTVMDVRLVFGLGLKCGASAIIVAHNHPTGNLQPSEADRQIARRIKEVGVLLQINALDFLIITSNNGYYSFADNSEYAHGGMMANGGLVAYADWDYDNQLGNFKNRQSARNFAVANIGKYDELIFEDESGDNIVVSKDDTKEDINYLFFSMAKGGDLFGYMEGVDLFEDYEDQPQEVQRILSKYEIEDNNYDVLQNLKAELEAIGYTMDFGLDAEPYDLRKIGQVGKSEFMAKGGITEHGLRVGDTIVSEIDANTIVVDNAVSGRRTINISTGQSMAKGGMSDKIVILVKDKKGNVVLRTTSTNKAADYCGLHGRENFTVETLDGRKIMAKGGKVPTIKESDIQVGRSFELANGEIIEIKRLFIENVDQNWVEYLRLGKLQEGSVNSLKNFINNFRKDIIIPSLFAKGGRMGFKALSEKVASHYAGKSVPAKYQSEYGKFYDADEAKTVGNKVAAKVYRLQQGK
jgi:DNA repair protein RadC